MDPIPHIPDNPLEFIIQNVLGWVPDKSLQNPLTKAVKHLASATLDTADFTDGGAAVGTIDIGVDIPANAFVLAWSYEIAEDLASDGDETAYNFQLGDGTDADRFNPTTDPSETIATQSADAQYVVPMFGAGGSGDGELHVSSAETTPTLTLTMTGGTGQDFTDVTAGKFKIRILYIDLAALASA